MLKIGAPKSRKEAQSALEYALMIACVVAALLAMQNYIRRAMQGKLRQSTDELGQQYAPGSHSYHTSTSDTTFTTRTKTQSEKILGFDLDEDGDPDEDGVFGAITDTVAYNGTAKQEGNETIHEQ